MMRGGVGRLQLPLVRRDPDIDAGSDVIGGGAVVRVVCVDDVVSNVSMQGWCLTPVQPGVNAGNVVIEGTGGGKVVGKLEVHSSIK